MAVHLSGDFLLLDGIEDLIDADAALFPAIGDFEIRLRQCGQLGVHLDLCSKAAGRLAGFSYWDHADADLREMNEARIPIGTADAPYHDHEQGWEILIWRRGADVFVLEGQDDPGLRFSSRFRVAFEEYRSRWSAVFAAARTSPGTFKSLEAALREPNLVTGLLLGNRRLTRVPHAVTWMKNLEFIDLYLNRLTTLPSNMGALQHLRWLDLRFNRIAMLPDSMGSFAASSR